MGTAELACASLTALAQNPAFEVVGVVTQPDRPKGRNLAPHPPPVKRTALGLNLPVFQPERVRHEEALQQLRSWQPEVIAVAAYGQILPVALLELPRWGCLNVHASLLPKYRGAAPIQWALLNGETQTGITIMKMDAGLDTGDILTSQPTGIAADDNAETLHDRLAAMGARLLPATILEWVAGNLEAKPQDPAAATHARKITKEDGQLDWRLPALDLWNRVRALNPWPTAYTSVPAEPKPVGLKIWQAEVEPSLEGRPGEILRAEASALIVACGEQALRVLSLQREGKKRLPAAEFLAGFPLKAGKLLA